MEKKKWLIEILLERKTTKEKRIRCLIDDGLEKETADVGEE